MAEDTDRLYRKTPAFARKFHTNTKSRQRVVPLPLLWYDGVGDI